jgi:hypothetical protein
MARAQQANQRVWRYQNAKPPAERTDANRPSLTTSASGSRAFHRCLTIPCTAAATSYNSHPTRASRRGKQANVRRAVQWASRSAAELGIHVQKSSRRPIEVHVRSRCMAAAYSSRARRHANGDNAVHKTGHPDQVRYPVGDRAMNPIRRRFRGGGQKNPISSLKQHYRTIEETAWT